MGTLSKQYRPVILIFKFIIILQLVENQILSSLVLIKNSVQSF